MGHAASDWEGKAGRAGRREGRLAAFLGFEGKVVLDLMQALLRSEELHPVTQAAFLFHA